MLLLPEKRGRAIASLEANSTTMPSPVVLTIRL
jgi:hypothetical protein